MATTEHSQSTWVEWSPWAPGAEGPLASLVGLGVLRDPEGEWVLARNRTPTHTIEEQERRGNVLWVRIAPREIMIGIEVWLIPTEGSPPDIIAARVAIQSFLLGVEVTNGGDAWVVEDVG